MLGTQEGQMGTQTMRGILENLKKVGSAHGVGGNAGKESMALEAQEG